MKRTATLGTVLALVVTMALAFGHGCGGSDNERDRERCETCNLDDIDKDCVEQCLRFCAPGEADCQGRCDRECDQCKAELQCRPCTSNCTGTVARCAPADEPLTCEDGTF